MFGEKQRMKHSLVGKAMLPNHLRIAAVSRKPPLDGLGFPALCRIVAETRLFFSALSEYSYAKQGVRLSGYWAVQVHSIRLKAVTWTETPQTFGRLTCSSQVARSLDRD